MKLINLFGQNLAVLNDSFLFIRRIKNALSVKKAPGRPRKVFRDGPTLPVNNTTSISNDFSVNQLAVKKTVPILEGEIIRLQRTSEKVDSDSDSEIDIDCSDDEEKRSVTKPTTVVKNEPTQSAPSPDDSPLIVENERKVIKTPIVTVPPPLPDPLVKYAQDDRSECESSETDSKNPDSGLSDAEPVQPVFTFPTPLEERTVDLTTITDEEKTIHWDFFEGRSSKTPERYIKIRNSIIHEWRRVKPRYLTKTSVRPSLKNCGDVNCISRVHAYLELTGAINFGCGKLVFVLLCSFCQANFKRFNRPSSVQPSFTTSAVSSRENGKQWYTVGEPSRFNIRPPSQS